MGYNGGVGRGHGGAGGVDTVSRRERCNPKLASVLEMTRTERASSPRALLKDRSLARNGMDKSLKKGGAAGGWGTLSDEIATGHDEYDYDEARDELGDNMTMSSGASDARKSPEMPRRASITLTEEERQNARDLRAHAFKNGEVDLASIARTSSAVAHSPQQPVLPALSNPNVPVS